MTAVPLALDGPSIYQQWLHLSVNFPGVTWTSNASLVSAGARFGVPLLGELLSVAVLVAAVYILWKRRPSALDTLAIGLMTVLLLGPVSWAGYTLFLLPFLFSRKWDRGTWAAVFLLDAPFSPEGAVSSVGKSSSSVAPALVRDVAAAAESAYRAVASAATDAGTAATNIFAPLDAAWNATVHAAQTLYPGMVTVGHPFVSAVLGSIYVWAVLLLLVRFMLEKMQEEPSLQPVQPETASLRDLRL